MYFSNMFLRMFHPSCKTKVSSSRIKFKEPEPFGYWLYSNKKIIWIWIWMVLKPIFFQKTFMTQHFDMTFRNSNKTCYLHKWYVAPWNFSTTVLTMAAWITTKIFSFIYVWYQNYQGSSIIWDTIFDKYIAAAFIEIHYKNIN